MGLRKGLNEIIKELLISNQILGKHCTLNPFPGYFMYFLGYLVLIC